MRKKNRKNLSYAMLPVMIAYTFAPNFVMIAAEMERKTPIRLAKASKKSNPTAKQPATKGKHSKSLRKDSGGENTSPAANSSGGVSIEVNQRTGGLEVNIKNVALDGVTDDMDVALGLVKTESVDEDKVPFSLDLPGGWAFSNVDYIDTTDQAEVTLHVSGNQFTVDANFASNLRYVRSKSRYLDLKARDFPYKHPQGNVEVHYTLMGCEGQNSYFGPNGKLWGRDDRFGNHVLYVYDKKDAKPFQAELREIIDSYGNEIKIDYESNKVIVEMPDKRTAEYAYDWNKRVLTVKDLKGLVTRLKLGDGGRVVEVEYPTGGETTYAWNAQAIPYKAADGSKQYFPAVVEVEHYPGKGSASPPMTEEYRYGLDGRYFTYWDHPFQASEGGDGLMESEDNTYTYTNRRILKGGPGKADDVWEDTTCNFLNLPVETAAYQGGKLMDSSIIHYEGETTASKTNPLSTNHKFQPRHDLPPNYSEPCSEAELSYGKSGKPRASLTLSEFNDYGLTTKVTNYTSVDGDVHKEHVTSVTTTQYYLPDEKNPFDYAKGYGQMASQTVRDLVDGSLTTTTNALSANGKFVKSSTLSMSPSGGKNAEDGKTSLNAVDAAGRPTMREIRFTNPNLAGNDGQPKAAEVRLDYKKDGEVLTVTRTNVGKLLGGEERVTRQLIDVANGWIKSEIDARGQATKLDYQDKGLTVKTTYPDGSWVETSEKDPNLTVTSHSTGLVEKSYLDGLGRVVKETDNLGPNHSERTLATYTYDGFGRLAAETDLYGHVTKHAYDYQGREIKTVDEYLGVVMETEYDDVALTSTNYLSTKDGAGGRVELATTHYNSDWEVVMVESLLANDGSGLRTKAVAKYDGEGREIHSGVVEISPDGGQKTIISTDSEYTIDGDVKSYVLNTLDGARGVGDWTRGLFGDAVFKTLTFSSVSPGMKMPSAPAPSERTYYNALGELIKLVNQKGQTITYSYDKNGNLKEMTDFAGTTMTYEYDVMNRMTLMTCGDIQQKNEYYDGAAKSMAAGQLKSRTLIVGGKEKDRIVHEYDERGLVSAVTRNGKAMRMTFDERMRIKTITDYADVTTRFDYCDGSPAGVPDENIKSISNKFGSVAYAYYTKANGPLFGLGTSLKELVYRDANGKTVATVEYDYYGLIKPRAGANAIDANQKPKLRSVRTLDAKGTLVSGSTYEYERGKVKTLTRTSKTNPDDVNCNQVKVYTYNDMGLLIREDVYGPDCESQLLVTEYEYDINRNVVTRTVKNAKGDVAENNVYEYNEIDQLVELKELTGKTARTFEYDENGNMTTISASEKPDVWLEKLDFNALNQMVRYRRNSGADVSYEYDAESLRKSKYPTGSSKNRIAFYYNDDDVINESDASGAMTSYLFAGGRRALRALNGKPQMWYVSDAKDVVAALDPSGNKQSEIYNYDAYGERTDLKAEPGKENPERDGTLSLESNPFGYNSEYTDSESGLIYLRARYYNPELMCFVSRDTYDVSNRYAYGDGDPINNIDPSGHNALSFTLAIASLVTSIVATGLTFGAAAPSTVGAVMAVAGLAAGAVGTGMEAAKTTQEDSWNDWEWREEDTFANVMSIASMGVDIGSGALAAKSLGQAGRYKGGARSWSAWGGKTGANNAMDNVSMASSHYTNPSMSSVGNYSEHSTVIRKFGSDMSDLSDSVSVGSRRGSMNASQLSDATHYNGPQNPSMNPSHFSDANQSNLMMSNGIPSRASSMNVSDISDMTDIMQNNPTVNISHLSDQTQPPYREAARRMIRMQRLEDQLNQFFGEPIQEYSRMIYRR